MRPVLDGVTAPTNLSGGPIFPLDAVTPSNTDAAPLPPEPAASVFTLHRITLEDDEKTSGLVRFICLGCHTLLTLPVVDDIVTCHCGERYRAESA